MELDTKVKKSLVELNYIIENMSESIKNKIPDELRKSIKENMDKDYVMDIDFSKKYTEQAFMDETKVMLSILVSDYIADGETKEKWKEFDDKFVEVIQSKVKTDVFNKQNESNQDVISNVSDNNKQLTEYKPSFISRFFKRILSFFKRGVER